MSSQYNISTDISNLLVQYYERKALAESEFQNGVLKYGQNAIIPEGNSATINWHRWNKFALASDLAEGSVGDPTTGVSMDTSAVTATLAEFGDFVRVSLYSDAIRLDSAAKQAYIKFTEQAARTANRRILTKLANTSTGFTRRYAQNAGSFAGLTNQQILSKDLQKAVAFIEQNQGPKPITCLMDPWTKADLMIDDSDFRDLIKHTELQILERNNLPMWAGAKLDLQDEPWREAVGGTEGTYVSTGGVISCLIFASDSFGKVALMGRTGLKPKWHVQNISPTGAEMTIGYRIPFAASVLNANWGVILKGVSRDASVSSVS